MVTDEVYERFVSEFKSLEDLEWDEEQEALFRLYNELEENALEKENIECIPLDTPDVINDVDWLS